nr:serine/arginine repetitive matrix protein 1 isoform X2 [Aegilops tauschii subsp. strangulata]
MPHLPQLLPSTTTCPPPRPQPAAPPPPTPQPRRVVYRSRRDAPELRIPRRKKKENPSPNLIPTRRSNLAPMPPPPPSPGSRRRSRRSRHLPPPAVGVVAHTSFRRQKHCRPHLPPRQTHRRPQLPPRQKRRRDSTSRPGRHAPPPPGFTALPRRSPPAAPSPSFSRSPGARRLPSCAPIRPHGHPRRPSMLAWWRLGAATEMPPRGRTPASAWLRPLQHTGSPRRPPAMFMSTATPYKQGGFEKNPGCTNLIQATNGAFHAATSTQRAYDVRRRLGLACVSPACWAWCRECCNSKWLGIKF